MEKASIKKIVWNDVRDKVAKVNFNLASVIDDIDPNNKFPLYIARYPYGSVIVREGTFHLPSEDGQVISIEDEAICPEIRKNFTYSGHGLPAGVMLENTAHESVTTSHQSFPLGVVSPGSIFALWKKLDTDLSFHPIKMFTITSGARFIFMLPNISDLSLHKNLKRDFNICQSPPKNLLDQWEIFKSIANHPTLDCNWGAELLFFSGQWFDKIKNDNAWQKLYLLLLERVWKKSAYERNQMFYDLAFSRAQANRNLKPNPYLADTVKHLLMMAVGSVAGFAVSTDETSAPIKLLQKVYLESYGLKNYVPTMLSPAHYFLAEPTRPIYYSLVLPTSLEFSPKSRKISSTLRDLSELRHVMYVFMDEVRTGKLKIEDTIIGKVARETDFDFFHSKPDKHGEIQLTKKMILGDESLVAFHKKYGKRIFADSGAFVRGCVRINKKVCLLKG